METRSNCLFITFVEKEGPFLKVWGQTDKNTSLYVEQVLHGFVAQFESGLCVPHPDSLQNGILCCAKYKDNKYYRAKITSLNFIQNRYIEVNFVDYGHKDVVPISNIRSLEGFDSAFVSIPPQAASFLLAEAVCPRGEWNDACLEEICKEIRYTEVNFSIIAQVTRHYLVRLFVGVNDLAILLISKGLMRHTSLTTQEAVLLSMMPRQTQQQQQQAVPAQSIATYKAFTLEPGSQYEVYVSYVTDGPCNFSIQLKQSEEVLGKLMKEINSMTLCPVEGIPIPGTVCLARCMEDGHICRAVVTNEVDGQFKVFYVDFGNFEVVPLEALYDIPFKYVIPKVMAIRFALAGVEKSTVTLEMQCAFKQFVDNRLIHMKVMPMTARTSLPRCELWDPVTQTSALDVVNQAAAVAYPDHISLNRGFSQPVKISYVFSCNRFYAQLKAKQDELLRLMLDIQATCRDTDPLPTDMVRVGQPCYALFEADQQWYRSQIVEILGGNKVRVHYVDYGNEEVIAVASLKPIEGRQLTVLRPQAIECCLNGYQNMEADMERDNLLEELILEQEFTMKVVEMQGKKALVELIDAASYNVASLLLDKIATTRSQVSPLLVQAGNKIEHRKSSLQYNREDSFKQEQKKFDRTNEINDNSWKQQNKGFNKNFDRNRRDTDLSDSNDSDRQSSKSFNRYNDRNKNDVNSKNNEGNSWRQNNKGFQKNYQDRPPRDNNRNNDWNSKDKEEWSNNRENEKRNFNSRDNKSDWGGNKEDGWGDTGTQDNWDNKERDDKKSFGHQRENFRKNRDTFTNHQDGWGDGNETKGGWDNKEEKRSFGHRDNFKRSDNRFNNDKDVWNSDPSHKSGGFKKRPDFKREASELSSSGSEKSFRKGFRDTTNQKPNFQQKKFDRPPKNDDSWAVTSSTTTEVPNAAPSTAKFEQMNVDHTDSTVIISWFHNPAHFYCQLENVQSEFKKMMEDIQQAYKSYQSCSSVAVGAPVIGLFPEDSVLYRAEVVELVGRQFKVYYVDFGNVSLIDKVWPIETRFMQLPAQALRCKLDGIEPVADSWSDVSSYGPYFDKKHFTCHFLTTDGDKVAVKLEHEGDDIGGALVRDGLAKAAYVVPDVDIALLIGQQFRAMLLSVNGLGDFVMSLQSGFLLNCAVFNLSEATETFEDNLKAVVEQILIVYVDDLHENTLQVTLYDQDGSKIKLIDRDEGAFETVELICPYLIQTSTLIGEISHVEQDTIYVQPAECAEFVEYLVNVMFDNYDNAAPPEVPITPTEGFVYAVKGSDTNWYRGRILAVEDDKQVKVSYIDYGNSETVEICSLRELTREYMETQILCVPVTLKETSEDLLCQFVTVDLTFTENGLEGVIRTEEVVTEVASTIEAAAPSAETVAPLAETVAAEEIEKPHGTNVILSHVDSPSDFYLQLADSSGAIEELQATLQEQISEMADMENPVVGVLCAAPYSLDQQWYRANILDADADITTVRFVDYGNTDVLDNQTTRVKTLPPNLLSLEVHATRCRLKITPIEEEWTTGASERFEELCDVENLTAQFLHQDEKTNYVELYSDGANIREILIEENLAKNDEVSEEIKSHGFVSHLNSPSEFWIQLENCVDELEWVAERLSGAESFSELEDLAPGTLCAALFPDDQMWYRARILSNTVAGIEVLFVDYGNSCTSCSLRELPEELVMVAPLAQKCSLKRPEGLAGWGPEMCAKFSELAADGQTTFAVNKLSTGETAVVELQLEGADVVGALLPGELVPVRVGRVAGLDGLVLEREGKELEGRWRLEGEWDEAACARFREINRDGETIFNAEFVSEDVVRLYLGLTDVRLELSGTKAATPSSSPAKSRTEREVKEIVEDIVEASINPNENFVKGLVEDLIEGSADEAESKDIIQSIVTDIVENSGDKIESKEMVESIVTDIVNDSTNEEKENEENKDEASVEKEDVCDEEAEFDVSEKTEKVQISIIPEKETSSSDNSDLHESPKKENSKLAESSGDSQKNE